MRSRPINLSTHQVQGLLQHGHCTWERRCHRDTVLPYACGERLYVRESVYKPTQGETGYLYLADGQQPGRYPHNSFHMPRAACRLHVTVAGAWYELDDDGQWSYHFTLRKLVDVPA